MIIDTSALAAIAIGETHWETMREAITQSRCVIPASVLTELHLGMASRTPPVRAAALALVDKLIAAGAEIAPFDHQHAQITAAARDLYGKGNGKGGALNFGDLMVYAVAKQRGEAVLCTGRDFSSTDLEIHPASRTDP